MAAFAIRAGFAAALAVTGCAAAWSADSDTVNELGFSTTDDFNHCARYMMESAMHANYEPAGIDGLCVEHCFPIGRAQGLDEPAMREIMAQTLRAIRPPPRYDAYDPRTFEPE